MEDAVTHLDSDFEWRGPRTYRSKSTRTILSGKKLWLSILQTLDLRPVVGNGAGMRPVTHDFLSSCLTFELEAYQVVVPTSSGAGLLEQALSPDLRESFLRDPGTMLFGSD